MERVRQAGYEIAVEPKDVELAGSPIRIAFCWGPMGNTLSFSGRNKMAELRVNTEDMAQVAPALRAGQRVLLSGVCYTSRDAAHKRITQMLDRGEAPPYDLNGAAIYYAGPTLRRRAFPLALAGPPPAAAWTPIPPLSGFGPQVHDRQGQAQPAVIEL